jgi:hypothetical protein
MYILGNGTNRKRQLLFFAAMENGNDELLFVFCKWKMKVSLPWSANDKRYLTFAVSATVTLLLHSTI